MNDENSNPNIPSSYRSRRNLEESFDTLRECKDKFQQIKQTIENTVLTERRSGIKIKNSGVKKPSANEENDFEKKLEALKRQTREDMNNWERLRKQMISDLRLNIENEDEDF